MTARSEAEFRINIREVTVANTTDAQHMNGPENKNE